MSPFYVDISKGSFLFHPRKFLSSNSFYISVFFFFFFGIFEKVGDHSGLFENCVR